MCDHTPDCHLYRVIYTRCHTDTINSPDDGHDCPKHVENRNKRTIKKELWVKLVIYKDYTEMQGQQNIKFRKIIFKWMLNKAHMGELG
jgi:hypothetical protein